MAVFLGRKEIKDVRLGGSEIYGIYQGKKLVWPKPMEISTDFRFGQTSTTTLETASKKLFTGVDDVVPIMVTRGGVTTTDTTTTDRKYISYAHLTKPMNKFEVSVSITLDENPVDDIKSGIVIGKPMSGHNFLTLEIGQGFTWLVSGTKRTDRGGWNLSDKVKPKAGDTVTLVRSRAGTNTRLKVLVNGVEKSNFIAGLTWAKKSSDRDSVGILHEYVRAWFTNKYSAGLSRFEAKTF